VTAYLELSFELGALDSQAVEEAAGTLGACAVTFEDAHDDPVFEPLPGEVRLWPATRVKCLFMPAPDVPGLCGELASALGLAAPAIHAAPIAERVWEREWLKDFHAMCFGTRLWICPRHEAVREPGAVVVTLDPGLAFGTGTHASTALCLNWLDAKLRCAARVIDYGCGSGVLAIAAAKLGACAVHAFDIDPQALIATRDNAAANAVTIAVHDTAATLPGESDVLLANILAMPLCELAPRFATLLRPGGQLVLAGLMAHEVADVTAAYAACFDVAAYGYRGGWVCLAGRRR
jgi:ribosomal protein L11 methyltransferase